MKDRDKNYSVARWTFGHLRSVIYFKSLTPARRIAQAATQDELRVLGDGITGSYIKSEYFGNRAHGYRGAMARPE